MKRILFYFLLSLTFFANSCKTKEVYTDKDRVIENPCLCDSDKESNSISYSAVGESSDEMYSKTKALSDARIGLASLIESRVLSISNKFEESENSNNIEDLRTKRKQATRLAVEQSVSNIRVACEKTVKTQSGTYKTYICLEIKSETIKKVLDSYYQL